MPCAYCRGIQRERKSPILFIIVMDVLASEVGTHPPWGLLFADDLALRLCAESSVEVEEELEK